MTYKSTITNTMFIAAMTLAAWATLRAFWPQQVAITPINMLPDAYMEEVTAVFMDKFGKPKMKIITPKLVHYLTDDTTQLTSPQLTLYRKSPQPWYISSRYAKATHGIDNVDFREDVTIHHPADENMPATVIKAPTLVVHPTNETAETNEPIELIQPNIIIKSTGMRANMNLGTIKLLSQAKGVYVPDAN